MNVARRWLPLLLVMAAGPLAVSGTPRVGATRVRIENFHFMPARLAVPVGAKVTWINRDEEPHTVVSVDGAFKSHALDTDESFSFTFTKAGTYRYFCSVHPKMVATVVVGGHS